jgi:hypothetical protein
MPLALMPCKARYSKCFYMATPPTISTAFSMAGILCLTHVEWNLLDSLFVGSLWILFFDCPVCLDDSSRNV